MYSFQNLSECVSHTDTELVVSWPGVNVDNMGDRPNHTHAIHVQLQE